MEKEKELESLEAMIEERDRLDWELSQHNNAILGYEEHYIDITSASPITVTTEYYLNTKVENPRKKNQIERMFGKDYPGC